MKYIAIFDLPEGYQMGCACGKMISEEKRKQEIITDKDFDNCYAQIEPLLKEQTEMFEKYNAVERIIQELGVGCAYDMPSFWTKGNEYKVIPTKYHKGYMQALDDVERGIRKKFGFAERENVFPYFFNAGLESRDNG